MTTNPTKATGIAVISIYVSDLQKALDFYVGVLGLEDKSEMRPGRILALGDSSFYLEPGREKTTPDTKIANTQVCFKVESIKAAYEALVTMGVEMVVEYTEYSPDFAMFMAADPDGNVVEFAGRP